LVLALAAAGIGAVPVEAVAARRDQRPTTWEITIAPRGEPGTPMILSGRVLSRDRRPLAGVTMFVYHADASGRYMAAGDPTGDPRLSGVLRTNERGEYRVHSVWPGQEGGAPPHLHYEVWGRGIPRVAAAIDLERRDPLAFDAPRPPTTTPIRPGRRGAGAPVDSATARFSYLPPVESRLANPVAQAIVVQPGKDGVLRGTWDLVVGR
jgi:hypothetical protein